MKIKALKDIKHGQRFIPLMKQPQTFVDLCKQTSMDKSTVQKVLADLQKYGYITKTIRGLWVASGDVHVEEENVS